MNNDTLNEFEKFPGFKSYVTKKYIPFHVPWARKFWLLSVEMLNI